MGPMMQKLAAAIESKTDAVLERLAASPRTAAIILVTLLVTHLAATLLGYLGGR